jgi:hypothetical protein
VTAVRGLTGEQIDRFVHDGLVHAAQPHRGTTPRFMAQPPLLPTGELDLENPASPVERAVRDALA